MRKIEGLGQRERGGPGGRGLQGQRRQERGWGGGVQVWVHGQHNAQLQSLGLSVRGAGGALTQLLATTPTPKPTLPLLLTSI